MPTNEELDKFYEKTMASGQFPSSLFGIYYRETGNEKDKATAGKGTRYVGPMQLGPEVEKVMGIDRHDPYQNITGGLGYAKKLQEQFDDELKGIAAYNWGPTRLRRHIATHGDKWLENLPAQVRRYTLNVHSMNPKFENNIPSGMLDMEQQGSRPRGSSAAGQPPHEEFIRGLSDFPAFP
jgi:hypothetical protein